MICPVCGKIMIIVEHHRIELDYCTQCGGVWFDTTELELFLEAANLPGRDFTPEAILQLPEVKETPRGKKCPLCHRKMKAVNVGNPPIVIDVCKRGQGLWFDGGEVQQLFTQLASRDTSPEGASEQVLAFLGHTFQVKKQRKT
jgi:Zn-finger nucleic acid-binding protein